MEDIHQYSKEVSEILDNSRELALTYNNRWILAEHIFLSIMDRYLNSSVTAVSDSNLHKLLLDSQLSYDKIKEPILNEIEKNQRLNWISFDETLVLEQSASRILDISSLESRILGSDSIETIHLILAILKDGGKLGKILEEYNINYKNLVKEMKKNTIKTNQDQHPDRTNLSGKIQEGGPLNSFGGFPDDDEEESPVSKKISAGDKNSDMPFLEQYSFNMTNAAKEGKFDPVVGREKELSQLIEILSCRKKNNAVLLGDPGVGKTSVVEALALKIASRDVPKYLLDKKICSLDLTALVSGTKYRGQYEERLQGIIKEVTSHPEIIIYIDEFHNLVGNGSSSGNGDGSNILKPYLARGEFQCIGSTTIEEYRKFVEKDGALKRRFQNIMVDQPDLEETKVILSNIKDKYQDHHKVTYPQEVIEKCVEWSGRYITDRFFPDKAIDALDLAGSRTKLNQPSNLEKIKELQDKIDELKQLKGQSVKDQDFEAAANYRDQEKKLTQQLNIELSDPGDPKTRPMVTLDTLAEIVGKISSVPVDSIGKSDMEKLRGMKGVLESTVIGQPEAIDEVIKSLQRNSLGLRDPKRPIASLMLVGPTGSGKTYLCKTLAKEFFGSEDSLIRFDMSEFSEKHEITKLTGSTASYVGYDDTPLFDQVRRRPYSVILFDEIEKAAKEIYQVFLSILDEGMITLGNGVRVDFKNTIIIFTGNVGTKELALKGDGVGFMKPDKEGKKKDIEGIIGKAIRKTFSPEFINRLSGTVVFNELSTTDMMKICDLELAKLSRRLQDQGYTLVVSKEVKELIVSKCDLKYGARDLQRNIVKYVEDNICTEMLVLKDDTKKNIKVTLKKDTELIKVKFN